MTPKSKTKRPAARPAAKTVAPSSRKDRSPRAASSGARPKAKAVARPVGPKRKAVASATPKAAPLKAAAAKTAPKREKGANVPLVKSPPAKKAPPPKADARPEPLVAPRKTVSRPESERAPVKAPPKFLPIASKPAVPMSAKQRKAELAEALQEFGPKDYIVYPTHGVGFIQAVERQEIAGMQVELFVVTFEKDKMTLRVPVSKAKHVGMRKLSTPKIMDSALATLKGRARVKRSMWSRRAQEYEAKINSGNPVSIAEVIRDLHRSANQPDQSYSERQIYEAALERLARELAAVEKIDEQTATERLENVLRAA